MAQYQKQVKRVTDQKGAPGYIYTDNEGNQSGIYASEQGAWNDLNDIRRSQPYYDPRLRSKVHSPIKVDHEETTEWEGKASEVADPKPVAMQEKGNRTGLMEEALRLGPTHGISDRVYSDLKEESALNRDGRDRLYEASDPEPMPDTSPMAQVARESTVNKPSFMGDMRNQGLDTSVGTVGEQPSEEQLGMLGRNPALAGINRADEQRTKDAIGGMDATDMAAAEAGKQRSEEVGAQQMDDAAQLPGQFARDATADQPKEEVDPASSELSQLNKEANSKNPAKKPKAEKERKDLFAGLSKEETAYAKEELGNYHIDPLSGHAINLDAMASSDQRQANLALLQYVPEHQRTPMLASFGYLDKEDVEGLPESDVIRKAEIEAASKLAERKAIEAGLNIRQTESLTTKTTLTRESNILQWDMFKGQENVDREKIRSLERAHVRESDLRKIGITSKEFIAMSQQDLDKEIAEMTDATKWGLGNRGFDIDDKKAETMRMLGVRKWDFEELNLDAKMFNDLENRELKEYLTEKGFEVQKEMQQRELESKEKVKKWDYNISGRKADIMLQLGLREADFKELELTSQEIRHMNEIELKEHLTMEGYSVDRARLSVNERIANNNSRIAETLGIKKHELGVLKQSQDFYLAIADDNLAKYLGDKKFELDGRGLDLSEEKMDLLDKQVYAQLDLQYKNLEKETDYKNRVLAQSSQEFLSKHALASKQQQQAMIMGQYQRDMGVFDKLLLNGQVESAFMWGEKMGLDHQFSSISDYWKSKGKTSDADPDLVAALRVKFKGKDLTPKFLKERGEAYYKYRRDKISELTSKKTYGDDEITNLEAFRRTNNYPSWGQLNRDQRQNGFNQGKLKTGPLGGSRAQYEHALTMAAVDDIMGNDPAWGGVHKAMMTADLRRVFDPNKKGTETNTAESEKTNKTSETKEKVPENPPLEGTDIGEVDKSSSGFKSDTTIRPDSEYFKGLNSKQKRRIDEILTRKFYGRIPRPVEARRVAKMSDEDYKNWLGRNPVSR